MALITPPTIALATQIGTAKPYPRREPVIPEIAYNAPSSSERECEPLKFDITFRPIWTPK